MINNEYQQPPRWARQLLYWYCRPEIVEDLDGDLNEFFNRNCRDKGVFRARLIYILDVVKFLRPYTIRRPKAVNPIPLLGYSTRLNVRALLKSPVDTTLTVLSLTLGLAAFLVLFFYVVTEFSYDTHFRRAEDIYNISLELKSQNDNVTTPIACADGPLASLLPESLHQVESATGIFRPNSKDKVYAGVGTYHESRIYRADSSYFSVFHHEWVTGDQRSWGEPGAIVLTETLALKYWGQTDVQNELIRVNDVEYRVAGVIKDLPDNTHLIFDALLYEPPSDWSFTYVLLRSDADYDGFVGDLNKLGEGHLGPVLHQFGFEGHYLVEPVTEQHYSPSRLLDLPKGNRDFLHILRFAALLILAITGFNFVNQGLSRVIKEQQQITVKRIFGAQRWQLVLHELTRTALLCLISFGLSIILIAAAESLFDIHFRMMSAIAGNVRMAGVGLAGIFLVLGAGSLIARLTFMSPFVTRNLRVKTSSPSVGFFRWGVLGAQFTISLGLVLASVIVTDQVDYLLRLNKAGFRDQVLIVEVPPGLAEGDVGSTVKQKFLELSFVDCVSIARDGAVPALLPSMDTYYIQPQNSAGQVMMLNHVFADEDYFRVLGIPLLEGRNFAPDDYERDRQVVIVNEALVRKMNWKNPLENEITYGVFPSELPAQVIGVVGDMPYGGMQNAMPIQFRLEKSICDHIFVRLTDVTPSNLRLLGKSWTEITKESYFNYRFLDAYYLEQLENENVLRDVLIVFALLACLIGSVGLIGLINISVAESIRANSIRLVLGADLLSMLLQGSRRYMISFIFAAVATVPLTIYYMQGWLESFVNHVEISVTHVLLAFTSMTMSLLLILAFHFIKLGSVRPLQHLRNE